MCIPLALILLRQLTKQKKSRKTRRSKKNHLQITRLNKIKEAQVIFSCQKSFKPPIICHKDVIFVSLFEWKLKAFYKPTGYAEKEQTHKMICVKRFFSPFLNREIDAHHHWQWTIPVKRVMILWVFRCDSLSMLMMIHFRYYCYYYCAAIVDCCLRFVLMEWPCLQ